LSRIAGLLLAAGRGTRFGGDKLNAMLAGRPVGCHAAATAGQVPLAWRFAVVAEGDAPPGFTAIRNPVGGQGRSLARGVAAARQVGADAVLVMLADMPLVSPAHLERLLACFQGPDTLAVSRADGTRSPPALIGRRWFDVLERLGGDRGAQDLLADAVPIDARPEELMDIDTVSDLDRARQWLEQGSSLVSGDRVPAIGND